MTTFSKVVKDAIELAAKQAQQGMVCEIASFDKQTMRADVKPLVAEAPVGKAAPTTLPILPNLPVQFLFAGGFYIRPDYQAGDMVWVTFATHDVDNSLKGATLEESKRVFDLSSASVSHGVAPTDWTPPAEFADDGLLIGHKDGAAYIQFEDSKITLFFGSDKIELDSGGLKYWDGAVFYNFKTHTHAGPGTPPNPNT